MKPKLEDLRKKAFLLYNGMEGVELVNREIKRLGIKEDSINQYQLKILLNTIIKKLFIDYIGLEKSKEILAMDVTHLPGYHVVIEEDTTQIHIFERINFIKWFIVLMVGLLVSAGIYVFYYVSSFDSTAICAKKAPGDAKDSCYMILALHINNYSLCNSIESSKQHYNCISSIAVKLNDSESCDKIPGDDVDTILLHDRCISCIAFNLNNKSLCTSFMSPITQDGCQMQIERHQSLTC